MSRLLYIDCFAGASGDMFLGAFLDLGVPLQVIEEELAALDLGGVSLDVGRGERHGIVGTRVRVRLSGEEILEGEGLRAHEAEVAEPPSEPALERPHLPDRRRAHRHGHRGERSPFDRAAGAELMSPERGVPPPPGEPAAVLPLSRLSAVRFVDPRTAGAHDHAHPHDHDHDHAHDHDAEHGRAYLEIDAELEAAALSPVVRDLARRAFRRLAEAEAEVHGKALDSVHFHEVGAVDAMVDVVGACAAFAHLAPDAVIASPVPLGRGMTRGAHGAIPLPAPAVVALLRGVPTYGVEDEGETITPTGAALLVTFAQDFGAWPAQRLSRVGHGVGARQSPSRPNLLRLALGEVQAPSPAQERLSVVEANVDDMSAELFGWLVERLFEGGARDVWLTPVQMKKGRPGTLLSVLCDESKRGALVETILRESTTLGVRHHSVERYSVARESVEVETPFGVVRVKVGRAGGRLYNAAPEYEDCRRAALAAGVPLKDVYAAASRAFAAREGTEGEP